MYVYWTSIKKKFLKLYLNSEDFPQTELTDFLRTGLRAAGVSRGSLVRVWRFTRSQPSAEDWRGPCHCGRAGDFQEGPGTRADCSRFGPQFLPLSSKAVNSAGSGFPWVVPPGCGPLARDRSSTLAACGGGPVWGQLPPIGPAEGSGCWRAAPKRDKGCGKGDLPAGRALRRRWSRPFAGR